MQPISIILADSHYLIREGLKRILSSKEKFQIVGEVTDEAQLVEQVKELNPQLVILDYKQHDHFSCKTVEKVREIAPQTNLLIISADKDKNTIYSVLENGVNSFLTKECDEEEILDAIIATAKGEKFFCKNVLNYILEKSFPQGSDCSPTPLTPREVEIVRLVASGLIAKEIAAELNLSTHTVYTHRKNIMKKLNLNSASELVLYAVNNGIV
jgi:DNA-binding NarL/FixJ family response regulator